MPIENLSALPSANTEQAQPDNPSGDTQTPGPDESIELKDMSTSSDPMHNDNELAAEPVVLPQTTTAKDKEIMTNRHVWVIASFLFLYVVNLDLSNGIHA